MIEINGFTIKISDFLKIINAFELLILQSNGRLCNQNGQKIFDAYVI